MPTAGPPPRTYATNWPYDPFDAGEDYTLRRAAAQLGRIVRFIRTRRDEQRLHQAALAELAGVDQSTISDLEAGKVWADARTLLRVLEVLDSELHPRPR